jgi:hypothetical protein
MFPLIRRGSSIQIEPVRLEDLRVGDLIVYQTPAEVLVAHRLIKKYSGKDGMILVTKGDAFPGSAAQIEPQRVLGRVVSVDLCKGRKLMIDTGWGRLLGIWLGRASPFISRIYPPLRRLRCSLGRLLQHLGDRKPDRLDYRGTP